jgi:hypothetical protein
MENNWGKVMAKIVKLGLEGFAIVSSLPDNSPHLNPCWDHGIVHFTFDPEAETLRGQVVIADIIFTACYMMPSQQRIRLQNRQVYTIPEKDIVNRLWFAVEREEKYCYARIQNQRA